MQATAIARRHYIGVPVAGMMLKFVTTAPYGRGSVWALCVYGRITHTGA